MTIGRISSSVAVFLLVASTTIGVLTWRMLGQTSHVEAQSVITVTKTADTADEVCNADCSIREALFTASSADTIVIPAGTYTLALGELFITKDLALTGAGKDKTIIQAATEPGVASNRVIRIRDSKVTIDGVTVRHGRAVSGGGVLVEDGELTLSGSSLTSNAAHSGDGGGIRVHNGILAISTSTISQNKAGGYGGGISNTNPQGTLTLIASAVTGNVSESSGGGIHSNGAIAITSGTIDSNVSGYNGGGIYQSSGILTIASSTISDNKASDGGGGIFAGSATITDTTIRDNSTANCANCSGGGLYVHNELNLTRVVVSGNDAGMNGGGIYTSGSGVFIDVTVSDNKMTYNHSCSYGGGGIYTTGGGTYTNTTVSGNYSNCGAGIYTNGDPLVLTNVTLSDNGGEGIRVENGGSVTMTNVTIAYNDRGIYNNGGGLNVVNSIIAKNNNDCAGSSFASLGHNLVGQDSGNSCFTAEAIGDLIGNSFGPIDPRLGPLQDNGGHTETHALLEGSLAIHAGDDSMAPSTDQRGIARPQGRASDIGAYERVLPEPGVGPPPVTTAPVELKAETTTARVGKNFALEIWTNATTSQAITGVEVYLNFDPSLLEVVDSQPSSGVQIEPDRSSLDTVLANAVYNTQGQVTYGAGKLAAPFPTSTFRVATIHFTAKQPTPDGTPTEVKFSFEGTRSTIVDFGGNHITGQHVDASVTLVQATVTGQVVLQGGSRPDGGWQVPLEVKFFTTSSDPLVDTPVETFNLTTQIAETDPQTGKPLTAIFTIASAPIGSYDITVDSPHTLMTIKRNVAIVDGQTSVDFGPLLEGDANDDGKINISDFGILGATFGGLADSRADFDRNGIVNISDFGLLAVNYAKMSPIDAP